MIVRHVRDGVRELVGWWSEDFWKLMREGELREGSPRARGIESAKDPWRTYGYPLKDLEATDAEGLEVVSEE
jgi:hypothetical protein